MTKVMRRSGEQTSKKSVRRFRFVLPLLLGCAGLSPGFKAGKRTRAFSFLGLRRHQVRIAKDYPIPIGVLAQNSKRVSGTEHGLAIG